MVWSLVWVALVAVGLVMFLVSRLPVMNPPQCPQYETSLPDGSRCIIGADIGAALLWLFSIGLMAVAALGTVVTPPAVLLVSSVRARRARERAARPGPRVAAPTWTPGTPDWAGRYPSAAPPSPGSTPDTNQLCLASTVLGILAVCFLVLFTLLAAPLGVAAVIAGAFGLADFGGRPAEGRRQAIAGIACGGGSVLVLLVAFLWFALTA